MYSYTGEGTLKLSRCGNNVVYIPRKFVTVPFKAGQRAWLKYQAQKGKIESVVVKTVKIISNYSTGGAYNVMYFDNLNAIFNESDLINQSDAINFALNYYQNRLYLAEKALECKWENFYYLF